MMEGDSVTLYTDLTEIHEGDNILWKYGGEKNIIAEISTKYGLFFLFDDSLTEAGQSNWISDHHKHHN